MTGGSDDLSYRLSYDKWPIVRSGKLSSPGKSESFVAEQLSPRRQLPPGLALALGALKRYVELAGYEKLTRSVNQEGGLNETCHIWVSYGVTPFVHGMHCSTRPHSHERTGRG